jgi:hypothetical protein
MKKQYKDNMNIIFRWMPNGIIHLAIILLLPIYIVFGIFKGGISALLKEWWGEFNSKWVFSEDYKIKSKRNIDKQA